MYQVIYIPVDMLYSLDGAMMIECLAVPLFYHRPLIGIALHEPIVIFLGKINVSV
jgi:hypothetical protein